MTKFNTNAYIDGELTPCSALYDVCNPLTDEIITQVAWSNKADAERALQSAGNAFEDWAGTPMNERIEWMLKLRDEVIKNEQHLRLCVRLESGKTWDQTAEDFTSLINSLQYYSEQILQFCPENLEDSEGNYNHTLVYEPVGVAVAFLAWNFPLLNLAFKIGPAMSSGCPIIIKPSAKTPLSAFAVGGLCAKIGLPKGVVNILCGDNAVVGDALSESKIPALLTLIGSIRTGRHIMSKGSTSIKHYSMELGGNAPALVLQDADLDIAADIICAVKFSNAGQICVTPNRVLVAKSIKKQFIDKLLSRAKAIKVGHNDTDTMGPVIDHQALDRIHSTVTQAQKQGAIVIYGGKKPENCTQGSFYMPTIINNVQEDMLLYREEIFGPVISLVDFEDEEDAIKIANATDTGLTAYLFTKNTAKAEQYASQLRFGEIQINGVRYNIDLPHIGMKQSGIGCDCSRLALNDYLTIKRISSPH